MTFIRYAQNEITDNTSETVLILSNIIILVLAVAFSWSVYLVILAFIMQNIVIGFFSAVRILRTGKNILEYKTFSSNILNKIKIMGSAIILTAVFIIFYGGINWLYLVFTIDNINPLNWAMFLIPIAIFIVPHLISYREKSKRVNEEYNLRKVEKYMYIPFFRVIPMTLVMFLATLFAESTILLAVFIILKTLADLGMHSIVRKLLGVNS
jgi:hypothetical protein